MVETGTNEEESVSDDHREELPKRRSMLGVQGGVCHGGTNQGVKASWSPETIFKPDYNLVEFMYK